MHKANNNDEALNAATQWLTNLLLNISINQLIQLANQRPRSGAMEALRFKVRQFDATKEPVPEALLNFMAQCFVYGPPKGSRGRTPVDNLMRDIGIACTVRMVRDEFHLTPTRNEAARYKDSNESACSIVAKAAHRAGLQKLGEDAVAAIWKRYEKPTEPTVGK
jgi:hypothetical protein